MVGYTNPLWAGSQPNLLTGTTDDWTNQLNAVRPLSQQIDPGMAMVPPNDENPIIGNVYEGNVNQDPKAISPTDPAISKASLTTDSTQGNGLAAPSAPAPVPKEAAGGPYGQYGDPRAPGWFQNNITQVQSPSGANFSVNRQAAPAFQGFLADLHAAGYNVDPKTSGGYNLRNITGGTTLSPHAYGVAIDINTADNPYSKDAKGGTLKTDLPPNVGQLAAKWGLDWGGNWTHLKDPMHFEYRGAPIGDQPPTMVASTMTSAPMPAPRQIATLPAVAAPSVQQVATTMPATPAPNALSSLAPFSGANLAAMTPYQRLAMMRQLQSLFAPQHATQTAQAGGGGTMTGGVDASIPLAAGRV
jgi:hypothetical protein